LCLFLEPIYFLFSRSDQLVTLADLCVQVVSLLSQLSVDLVLTIDKHAFFRDLPLQVANLCFDLNQFVLGKLQLSLALQTHILNVNLVRLVLLVDVVQLEFCVLLDLLNCLLIFFSYG